MAEKKKEQIKTSVWAFWIIIAVIGVCMLFAGIQSSVSATVSRTVAIMLIVVGIILLFIGLVMTVGKANIIANDLEMPKMTIKKEDKKKENKE